MRIGVLYMAIFLLAFRPLIPIAEYVINYDYISKVLCINKDNQELDCNGKCYLTKELAKTTDNTAAQNAEQNTRVLDVFTCDSSNFEVERMQEFLQKKETTYHYLNSYNFSYYGELLRPPMI